jgi:hypothetical protein
LLAPAAALAGFVAGAAPREGAAGEAVAGAFGGDDAAGAGGVEGVALRAGGEADALRAGGAAAALRAPGAGLGAAHAGPCARPMAMQIARLEDFGKAKERTRFLRRLRGRPRRDADGQMSRRTGSLPGAIP